ncbi:MAG: hypothetical protein K1X54_10635 [Flavobacteriales bacterium]|nr:hypothetical protein [Flavobacteriales bacterium]
MEKESPEVSTTHESANTDRYSIFAAPDQTKPKMAVTSSRRLVGIDVAYGLAVFGCIVYAFWFIMGDKVTSVLTQTRFSIFLDVFPALFFFLNGFTVTLTMRDRRVSNRKLLSYLGKRGSVLFLIGLSCCVIWPMNIFIASGLMYIAAPFVAQWNNVVLRLFTLMSVLLGIVLLYVDVPTYSSYNPPTLGGGEIYNVLGFLLFNGYYSILPWFTFFFAGLLFGRTEIRPRGILPPSSLLGIGLILLSFVVNRYSKKLDNDVVLIQRFDFFLLNIRLLFPAFCVYGIGISIVLTNTLMYVFRKLENRNWLKFIQTISSMKYSLFFFHTVIGLITLSATNLQFFSRKIVLLAYVVLASFLSFYLIFTWRKRVSEQGPMEWLIKRISGSAKK